MSYTAVAVATLGALFTTLPKLAAAAEETRFLEFPIAVRAVAAENADAFAWLVRQGDQSKVLVAHGPKFTPVTLDTRADHEGQTVTDIAISSDGGLVAFMTGTPLGAGRTHNPAGLTTPPAPAIWIAPTRSGATVRRLATGTSPMFVGAARLTYRDQQGLHIVDLQAEADKDTALPEGAAFEDIRVSPDGSAIAFAYDRGGYAFLGTYKFGEDRVRWLVTGPDRADFPVWSPDGKRIAYLQRPGREHDKTYDYTESEPLSVHVVDVQTGEARKLWQSQGKAALSDIEDPDGILRWAGDDQLVFHSEHDGWGRLYSLSIAGGQPVAITPAGCEIAESEQVSSSELLVIHNCDDLHTRQAAVVDVRKSKLTKIPVNDVVLANAAITKSGFAAFTGGDARTAPLMRILQVSTRRTVFREEPQSHGYRFAVEDEAPRVVTFKAQDGIEVPAQLFSPKGRGPHPAVIFVHGGPPRQMFPAYHYGEYYARCFALNRKLAELGYVVLSVNFRSGIGYGREFREPPDRAWRGAGEYRDVVAAARWLNAREDVDRKRIGIWGGSYGGLLTAQALARNPELFAAGVSVHGVYDWSWPTERPGHLNPSRFFGVSDADRKTALASSPLPHLNAWKAPVLLFTGDADMNVDVLETVDLTQKLRARGVTVETVLIPGEAHGFVRNETWLRLWREMHAFLDRHLRRQTS